MEKSMRVSMASAVVTFTPASASERCRGFLIHGAEPTGGLGTS
jgi:hypothetical protein